MRLELLAIFTILIFISKPGSAEELTALPGAKVFNPTLQKQLIRAFNQHKQAGIKPRTKHLTPADRPLYFNRLLLEPSPYLLQHAHNPVDWHPWGEEAFNRAKEEKKLILLSVGYSTCHWCHVMEEESFEDVEIAEFLNQRYIAIKVDRELRPDVDKLYMKAVQMMTGRGGWPMTVWLTPELKPVFGGTYFPARTGDRGNFVGFFELLKKIHEVYVKEPDKIKEQSQNIFEHLLQIANRNKSPDLPKRAILDKALVLTQKRTDHTYGGLEGAPKFPSSFPLRFLIRVVARTGKHQEILDKTLKGMFKGGIYDHLAGGFHRYSTDRQWLVPHFEKMLYDNALLSIVYLEAFQLTQERIYQEIAEGILEFVRREMMTPEGAFVSAIDADSIDQTGSRREGVAYTWTLDEIDTALDDQKEAKKVIDLFGITREGNYESRNVLSLPTGDLNQLKQSEWRNIRKRLLKQRSLRPQPLIDTKVITAWNGLMISAFAKAGRALNKPIYIELAQKAARQVFGNKSVALLKRAKNSKQAAFLDDYAFMTAACLDLFEATGDPKWYQTALKLDLVVKEQFEDKEGNGLFHTRASTSEVLVREKPLRDGAIPAADSIHAENLIRLGMLTANQEYHTRAESIFKLHQESLERNPLGHTELLVALNSHYHPGFEIVIVHPNDSTTDQMDSFLRRELLAGSIITPVWPKFISNRLPMIARQKQALDGQTTVYVCRKGVCKAPARNVGELKKQVTMY